MTEELTHPIAGIENHTAQEVFDMTCDRIRRARPSPTGEKVEAGPVAWRYERLDRKPKGGAAWIVLLSDRCPGASSDVRNVTPLYSASTIAALVAERDEARQVAEYLFAPEEMQELQSALATANARVERLEEAFRIATDALDGLSYIHDGNPSDAMADMPPVDYARHMLYEARMVAREAAANARAALTGGEDG